MNKKRIAILAGAAAVIIVGLALWRVAVDPRPAKNVGSSAQVGQPVSAGATSAATSLKAGAAGAASAGAGSAAAIQAASKGDSGPSVSTVTLDPAPSLARDAPSADGWTTETVTEELNKRLKKLGKAIAHKDSATIAKLLASEPDLVGLPRGRGVGAKIGDVVQVTRHPAGMARLKGKDKVAAALAALGRGPGEAYLKFKLDGIQVDAGIASIHTRVTTYWPARCKTAGCPRTERHGLWQMRWRLDPANHSHLLVSATLSGASMAVAKKGALFEDVTGSALAPVAAQATILADADTWLRRHDNSHTSDPIGHQGLAVGDVNGDGLDDVYVCAPSGVPNRLLIQQPDGTVKDAAHKSGVAVLDLSRSALLVDFDNDGDQDLVVATRSTNTPKGTAVLLFAGDGKGDFGERRVIIHGGDVHSLAAADFDSDGDVDLFACLLNADKRIEGGLGIPVPYHDATNGGPNILLSNEGKLRFRDVTQEVGLNAQNSRWSYAAAWEDYDNDGDLDLYVANDFGKNNLYRNDKGRFVDVTAAAGVEDLSAGMSVSWGDVDRDGDMDLYVSNMYSSAGRRIAAQSRFQPKATPGTRRDFLRHARGNTLFRNEGNGTFVDIAETAGASVARWAWGSLLADLDGDGWQDALVVNGMFTRSDEHDL